MKLAQDFGLQRQLKIDSVPVGSADDFERALSAIIKLNADALYVYPDPLTARFAKATIAEAQAKIEAWRRDYNQRRPHGSLGHLTPTEFIAQRQVLTGAEAVPV